MKLKEIKLSESNVVDKRDQFPKFTKLVNWALDRAKTTEDEIEYEGQKYKKIMKSFTGDLGSKAAHIQDEIDTTGRITLYDDGLKTIVASIGGKYRSDVGKLTVVQIEYIKI